MPVWRRWPQARGPGAHHGREATLRDVRGHVLDLRCVGVSDVLRWREAGILGTRPVELIPAHQTSWVRSTTQARIKVRIMANVGEERMRAALSWRTCGGPARRACTAARS